jgi:hypothetical protein
MDIVSNELKRSWTSTYLNALELQRDFSEYLAQVVPE